VPISTLRNLSSPVKQFITILVACLLLFAFLAPLGLMVMRHVQGSLDRELYHQMLTMRRWFVDTGYYLRDEARLLAEFDAFEDTLNSHDEMQLRRLMALYQRTHGSDGIYLITDAAEVLTASASPRLDEATVIGLDIVRKGFNGQTLAEMITADGKIWLMAVAPHAKPDGVIDAVFLITREVDPAFLQTFSHGLNGTIALTDGVVQVRSSSVEMPEEISASLHQAVESQTGEMLQPYTVRSDGVSYRVLAAPLMVTHSGSYAIALIKNAESVNAALWRSVQWGAVLGVISIVLALALVQFHIVNIFRPLRSLTKSTKRIAAGHLDEPLEVSGVAEVYDLAVNFDRMRARLKALLERERMLAESLELQVEKKSQALAEVCRVREHLLAQLISSQEEERRRVSRELHDATSQELANLIVRLGALSRMVEDEEVLKQINVLRTQAVQTLEGVNRIVLDLRPGLLDEYGLVPAVHWYADARLESTGISARMDVKGSPHEISSYAQASIYRMVQEAINNVAQHSQASEVVIRIDWRAEELQIEVEDDGIGFDTETAFDVANGHYGLLGIRERVALLSGALDIQSSPGAGTRIIIRVPYALNTARKNGKDQSSAG